MVERPIRKISYDKDAPRIFLDAPELLNPAPRNLLKVRIGGYKLGDNANIFASEGFIGCSGFIFKNKLSGVFGLLHATPVQSLYAEVLEELKPLIGGQMILVEGSTSVHNGRFIKSLEEKLNIEYADTIYIKTMNPRYWNEQFHIVFRPKSNEIVIARNAYNDLLVYKGFRV
jgi:hypothetical protein